MNKHTFPSPGFSLFANRLTSPGGIVGGALCMTPQYPPRSHTPTSVERDL